MALVGALRAWDGRPPVGVKVLIEGQEEVGGAHSPPTRLVGFVIVSSLTLIAPLAYGLAAPRHSQGFLGRIQLWLVSNNRPITAGVLGVLGAVVTFSAVQDLLAM